MRRHAWWIGLLAVLAIAVVWNVRSDLQERADRRREAARAASPGNQDRWMGRFGYRRAPVPTGLRPLLPSESYYVYCPDDGACPAPAAQPAHPPVSVWSWTVTMVHVWLPASPNRLTVCLPGSTLGQLGIMDEGWAETVGAVAEDARRLAVGTPGRPYPPGSMPYGTSSAPGPGQGLIPVRDWQCVMPRASLPTPGLAAPTPGPTRPTPNPTRPAPGPTPPPPNPTRPAPGPTARP